MDFFAPSVRGKLFRSLSLKTSPLYVQYYLTARCDLTCQQCQIVFAQADCPEMPLPLIRRTAENLAAIGVAMVLLIGGEPFIRADLPEIVKAFVDNDIHVRMQTNGLASRRMLAACVEAGGHDISISLDSLEAAVQDGINGRPGSWARALEAVALVGELFPENGTGFFGTVLMPANLHHLVEVVEFATAIGWWVSLVPCHVTTPDRPLGFRTFDDRGVCRFSAGDLSEAAAVLDRLKALRREGRRLYDCDEYLDDILRFVSGQPIRWRRRNDHRCDSPNLYFAIEPNGHLQPCCDYKMDRTYPVYAPDFPARFRSGEIQAEVERYTRACPGCMYGSYPEMSLSARFLRPMLHRYRLFSSCSGRLARLSRAELMSLAGDIVARRRSASAAS